MNLTNLNQKIILKTGIFGILMGISTTLGWCQEKEIYILFIMIIGTILYLKKNLNSYIFSHSIIIGLSWGFDCSLIQIIFIDTYLINNPFYANIINSTTNINSSFILILIGVFWGLISGTIIWISLYLTRKLRI
jgi:lysylphosphatidylglycerol synthetase-like protein (DUF2156 family)|tara:strand:- start:1476 stop:1877 length:402 start_codon:yes stop_codon:yes gene_type:complete